MHFGEEEITVIL